MEHTIFQATVGGTRETVQRALCEALGTIERRGWIHGQGDRFAFWLCLEEAVSNAVRHGNRDNPGLNVGIEVSEDGATGRITVRDEGEGFDPERLEMPDPEAVSGRGVCLMRHFASRLWYDRAKHCLTMEFDLKPAAAPEPKGE